MDGIVGILLFEHGLQICYREFIERSLRENFHRSTQEQRREIFPILRNFALCTLLENKKPVKFSVAFIIIKKTGKQEQFRLEPKFDQEIFIKWCRNFRKLFF